MIAPVRHDFRPARSPSSSPTSRARRGSSTSSAPRAYAEALAEHRRSDQGGVRRRTAASRSTLRETPSSSPSRRRQARSPQPPHSTESWPGPIHVRVGLHTGTPLVTDEGYVGDDVHRAARIAAVGHGGQVLVRHRRPRSSGRRASRPRRASLQGPRGPERVYQLGDRRVPAAEEPLPLEPPARREPARRPREGARRRPASDPRRSDEAPVTITGPGGVGKTRFALAAAAGGGTRLPRRRVVRSAGIAPRPDLVLPTVADAIGADGRRRSAHRRQAHASSSSTTSSRSSRRRRVSRRSRASAHACGFSSRAGGACGSHVEREYQLPPLPESASVELFRQRASAVASDDRDRRSHGREICDRLDRLPLAIELAAARCKALSPEQILERLSERLDLLRGGRDADERQPRYVRRSPGATTSSRTPTNSGSSPGSQSSAAAALSRRPKRSVTSNLDTLRRSSTRAWSAAHRTGGALQDARDDPRVRAGTPCGLR